MRDREVGWVSWRGEGGCRRSGGRVAGEESAGVRAGGL
jgi:hypothetical protein